MALFFVDANLLLDLYVTGGEHQKLLPLLAAVGDDLFVTEQVAEEVQRNKLKVVADATESAMAVFNVAWPALPTHLTGDFDDIEAQAVEYRKGLSALAKQAVEVGKVLLREVGCSADPVSNALAPILARARAPSNDEVLRAKQRWRRGTPPGKPKDPLGDQLTWEQLLGAYDGKSPLWIATRDGDYFVKRKAIVPDPILNSLLFEELQRRAGGAQPDIRVFDRLGPALEDYAAYQKIRREHAAKAFADAFRAALDQDKLREEAQRAAVQRLEREQAVKAEFYKSLAMAGSAILLGAAAASAFGAAGRDGDDDFDDE